VPAADGVRAAELQPEVAPLLSESDAELVRRCRLGEETAWRALVTRHTRKVFALAYRFVGRVDQAEDLTQDIFIKVYRSLDRYRDSEGAFGTWLMTVARNQAIDQYRRRREERLRDVEDPELLQTAVAADDSPLHTLERAERVRLVHRGLRALPAELREPIVLCDLQGVAYEEAAAALGIPLGTVKSRLNRGRLELAKRLLGRRESVGG
jgi:RNA polymerase sigma-70 factor (ECF subfamily)